MLAVREGSDGASERKLLMMWCLQAPLFGTKKGHGSVHPLALAQLPDPVMAERLNGLPPKPASVITDEELQNKERESKGAASSLADSPVEKRERETEREREREREGGRDRDTHTQKDKKYMIDR